MSAEIVAFAATSAAQRESAAAILIAALAHVASAWRDLTEAREEVASFIGNPERLAFAAIDGSHVLGWIGAIRHTEHAWELHPLVVDPVHQRRGCGTRLVRALEAAAREAGIATIWLGTDDDFGGTNLFGCDLYPDVLGRLQHLKPAGGHPYTFYHGLGYAVVGVLPDVDGPGKHDILMARRL